jgi:type II secretory pathway component PulM
MKAWWFSRTARERLVMTIGGGVLAALLLVQAMVAPLLSWRASSTKKAADAEANYRLVAEAAATAAPPASGSATPVRNLLNDAARTLNIDLTFVNALPDGSVDVQAGPVAPEKLFELLAKLERESGVKVKSADIARTSEDPNRVRVQATLAK